MAQKPRLLVAYISLITLVFGGLFAAAPAQALAQGECDPNDTTQFTLEFTPTSADPEYVLPLDGFTGTIDWGDGDINSYISTASPLHGYTLNNSQPILVCITGSASRFGAYGGSWWNGTANTNGWHGSEDLTSVVQWGDLGTGFTSLEYAFLGASRLVSVPSSFPLTVQSTLGMFRDATIFNDSNVMGWNTSNVVDMTGMFHGASAFNQNIGSWNTSLVTDMNHMFAGASNFNRNITRNGSSWNTSNVTNMSGMFAAATDFNGDISNWDTSNVVVMSGMFANNYDDDGEFFTGDMAFNQDISAWNTSQVTYMSYMFYGANRFNQDISGWSTDSVSFMDHMFDGAVAFDQDIGNWDTGAVLDMNSMFRGAYFFNPLYPNDNTLDESLLAISQFDQDISSWNTHNVTDMSMMFAYSRFDHDLNPIHVTTDPQFPYDSWDTSRVTSMNSMFGDATLFNGDITGWDTSSVVHMESMFEGASSFNQNIQYVPATGSSPSSWDTSHVQFMSGMFNGATLFNGDISGWRTDSLDSTDAMFLDAHAFNQDISNWDVSRVMSFWYMFQNATSFNQPIGRWQTSQAEGLQYMFNGATSFNQDISSWYWGNVENASNMLDGSGMSALNYSRMLRAWANGPHQPGGAIGASNIHYFNLVETQRQTLVDHGWAISDAGAQPVTPTAPIILGLPNASQITDGQSLSSSTLSGGIASVPGTFTFTDPSFAPVLGTRQVSITFTPDDDFSFTTETSQVSVEVVAAPPAPTPPTPPSPQTPAPTSTLETAALVHTGSDLQGQTSLGWMLIVGGLVALVTSRVFARRRARVQQR
ncbi:BspA family leucine-rich repeat surface protein [uncultured Aurantimicrobium sp.]|uniref:BspA family leucine-rich repeat surface protein n=1 Tax=uncultured Aurantimicrobium sp. TaxID=1705357 RepID=UPI002608D1EA|nr:BspA family leucine-rich repeat surface protein [uncultured Aurantimicrobium sp.]